MYNAWFALSGVICEKIIKEFKDKACFFCTGRYNDPIDSKQARGYKMAKWISNKSANGKIRTVERMGIFAINNAFAEKLPFTALNCLGQEGKNITYNV
jgi:hypothetical protein